MGGAPERITARVIDAPVDDFISGAGEGVESADRLLQIGLLLSLTGLVVAAGVVAFVLFVVRRADRPPTRWTQIVVLGGVLGAVGAAIEVAGVAQLVDTGWFDALTVEQSGGPLLRLVAGVVLVAALVLGGSPAALIAGSLAGLFSFAFDGHTVSRGPRAVHALTNVVHVSAGAIWVGGVLCLAIIAIGAGRDPFARAAVRFSPVATAALIAVAVAGGAMSVMIVDSFSDLVDTTWGRTLGAKVAAVAIATGFGAYHHFRLVPALERDPDDTALLATVRRSMSVEAAVLFAVVVITAFLTRAAV